MKQERWLFKGSVLVLNLGVGFAITKYSSNLSILNNRIHSQFYGIFTQFNGMTLTEIRENDIRISRPAAVNGIALGNAGIAYIEAAGASNANNKITHNRITQDSAYYGIFMNGAFKTTVFRNEVELTENLSLTTGIGSVNGEALQVGCNIVKGTVAVEGPLKTKAFHFTATDASTVTYNSSLNTGEGFRIDGGSIANYDFNYNTIGGVLNNGTLITGTHDYGMRIGVNTIIGTQLLRGNTWEGSFTLAGARHDDPIASTVYQSQFEVDCSLTQNMPYMPSVSVVPPVTIPDFFVCSPGIQPPSTSACGNGAGNRMAEYTETDEAIAEGDLAFSLFEPTQNWEADRSLYRKIVQDSTLTDSLFLSYRDSVAETGIGAFESVRQNTIAALTPSGISSQQLSGYLAQIGYYQDSLMWIDSLLYTHPLDSVYWLGVKDSVYEILHDVNLQYQTLSATLSASRNAALDIVYGNNAGILSDSVYTINQKIVNDIYLSTVARGQFAFNPLQILQLENLIYQCPLAGGRAVYQARALYSLVNDTLVYHSDSLNCSQMGLSWRKAQDNPTFDNFSIVPNPGTDKVKVSWDKNQNLVSYLIIYTASGIKRKHIDVKENSGELVVDISDLVEGFYLFQFTNEQGQNLGTIKFIKQ